MTELFGSRNVYVRKHSYNISNNFRTTQFINGVVIRSLLWVITFDKSQLGHKIFETLKIYRTEDKNPLHRLECLKFRQMLHWLPLGYDI